MQMFISGFTHVHSRRRRRQRCDEERTQNFFEQLMRLNMNTTILRNCSILKAVKLFSEEFS